MELSVDIKKLAKVDPFKLMKKGDNFYKVCSRYLGFLTKRIDVWLKAEGYRLISTSTTDIKTATYYYRKDSLEAYIKQILALKDDDLLKEGQ